MLELVIDHQPGTFSRCRCGREPRHVAKMGARPKVVGVLTAFSDHGVRHVLECCRCGVATPAQTSLRNAIAVWGQRGAQRQLSFSRRLAA